MDPRCPQRRVAAAEGHLENLYAVLQVHEPAGRKLRIETVVIALLLELDVSKTLKLRKVNAIGTVDKLISYPLGAVSKVLVATDPAHPNQGELFQTRRLGAVVLQEACHADGQWARVPVGAQTQIELKNSLAPRLDHAHRRMKQLFEKLAVGHGVRTVGLTIVAVQEQDLDIRGVAERFAAHLAEAHNRVGCFNARHGARYAVARVELLPGDFHRGVDHGFREGGETPAQEEEVGVSSQDMIDVNEVRVVVLELVENTFLFSSPVCGGHGPIQSTGYLARFETQSAAAPLRCQHGDELFVVESEKVFP